jgi:hypothetical protein
MYERYHPIQFNSTPPPPKKKTKHTHTHTHTNLRVQEYAVKPMDVLARRTRLAFLDSEAARASLPRVVKLMGACMRACVGLCICWAVVRLWCCPWMWLGWWVVVLSCLGS